MIKMNVLFFNKPLHLRDIISIVNKIQNLQFKQIHDNIIFFLIFYSFIFSHFIILIENNIPIFKSFIFTFNSV